jgi:AraC-like DNA-binding protein
MKRKLPSAVHGIPPNASWQGVRQWDIFEGSSQILPEVKLIGEFNFKDVVPGVLQPGRHVGLFEVNVILEGSREIWFSGIPSPLVFRRGFGMIVQPGQLHGSVRNSLDTALYLCIQFSIPDRPAVTLPGISSRETGQARHILEEASWPMFEFSPELTDSLLRLLEEHRQQRADGKMAARGYFLAFLAWLLRDLRAAQNTTTQRDTTLSPEIARSLSFVQRNIGRSFSIDEMAATVGLSPGHFRRLFHEEMGLSPHSYLIRHRVDVSKQMLMNTGKSVTDIAMDLGFASSAHFASVFRRFTGTTPLQFRDQFIKPLPQGKTV